MTIAHPQQLTNLHNSPNPDRQRHPRHSIEVPVEEPGVRPHRLVRQSLHSCPRRQAGPGLVEGNVPVRADAPEEEVDAAERFDLGFERGALGFEVCGVAVEDVHVLAGYVDVGEEVGEHEGVVGFRVVSGEVDVFVLRLLLLKK
jgi:hypothetical protein